MPDVIVLYLGVWGMEKGGKCGSDDFIFCGLNGNQWWNIRRAPTGIFPFRLVRAFAAGMVNF
jgi:hypothetical protein